MLRATVFIFSGQKKRDVQEIFEVGLELTTKEVFYQICSSLDNISAQDEEI